MEQLLEALLLAVVLLLAFYAVEWGLSKLQKIKSKPKPKGRYNNYKHRPSSDFLALIDAIRTEGGSNREEEQTEEKAKKFREYLTIVLLVLTVIEMVKVYEPIRVQADATERSYVASSRPWIRTENVTANGPLTFDDQGAHVKIDITIRNIGRSPAVHIWFPHNAIAHFTKNTDVSQNYDRTCESWRDRPLTGPGFFLFPESQMTQTLAFNISREEVDKALEKPVSSNIRGMFTIYILGCIDYSFSFQDGHHQTPFVHEIDKSTGPQAWEFEHFDKTDKEIQPANLKTLTNPMLTGRTD